MSNYIGNQPSQGEFKRLDSIASSFNGSTTQFNLTYNTASQVAGDPSQLIVSLNGIIQEPMESYTLGIGGNSIIFSSAPASGDTCHIVLLGGVGQTTTPTDGSVTASKLDAALKDYYEDEFTASGGTDYTLSREAIGVNQLMVTIDGIVQPTSAYSATGTTLTISPALPTGTNIRVVHMGVKAGVYVPQAGSIGLNELDLTAIDARYYQSGDSISVADITVSGSQGEITLIDSDGPHSSQLVQSGYHLYIQTNENNGGAVRIRTTGDGSVRDRLHVNHNGDISFYDDTGANAKFFWDASTESLGIGTTVTTGQLNVSKSGGNTLNLIDSSGSTPGIRFANSSNTALSFIEAPGGNGLSFFASSTEAMRIDSSGNLLVGTTLTPDIVGNGGAGYSYRPSAGVSVSANTSGGTVIATNRTSYDGTHILFFRSASAGSPQTVGRITNHSVDMHIENASGGGADAGIALQNNDRINPVRNSALSDGTIDLGYSNYRWRNLYLSGGVVFDAVSGNATSNTLDDYEEGTWTPTCYTSIGSMTFGNTVGRYTKVGRVVHLQATVALTNVNSGRAAFVFHNLPFVQYANSNVDSGLCINYPNGSGTHAGIIVNNASGNNTQFFAEFYNSTTVSSQQIWLNITYTTT